MRSCACLGVDPAQPDISESVRRNVAFGTRLDTGYQFRLLSSRSFRPTCPTTSFRSSSSLYQ
jgi:hypothetical protein